MEGGGEAVFEPSVPAWGVQGVGMELTTASIAFTEEMWVIEAVHYAIVRHLTQHSMSSHDSLLSWESPRQFQWEFSEISGLFFVL